MTARAQKPSLRIARSSDAPAYASHLARHLAASGKEGELHYAPVEGISRSELLDRAEKRWATPLSELGWGRSFLLFAEEAAPPPAPAEQVVGHVDVRGSELKASAHRASYSIGLDREQRGKGLGEALTVLALDWLRIETAIEYVDLGVFTHNPAARALYRKLGFRETGLTEDAFRLSDGTRIDDVSMSLRIQR